MKATAAVPKLGRTLRANATSTTQKTPPAQPKAKLPISRKPAGGVCHRDRGCKRAAPQPIRLTATPLAVTDTARGCPLLRLDVDLREDIWCHLGDLPVLMRMSGVCVNFYNHLYGHSGVIRNVAALKAEEVTAVKVDAEAMLSKAISAIEAAARALDVLNRNAITEMCAFAQPPRMLGLVGEAVLALLNPSTDADIDVSWKEFRKQARKGDFMGRLVHFDKDNLSPRKLARLRRHMREIDLDQMRRVSTAGDGLAQWCNGIYIYASEAREVHPKREKLRALSQQLQMIHRLVNRSQKRCEQQETERAEAGGAEAD